MNERVLMGEREMSFIISLMKILFKFGAWVISDFIIGSALIAIICREKRSRIP